MASTLHPSGGSSLCDPVQDGQALVRHGETGVRFFVIRYGLVSVMRPLPDGGRQEVAVMRRGQFVGERTLITGELELESRCWDLLCWPCKHVCQHASVLGMLC